jgi:branched-chain amino acid transport system substrate-binding protein
MWRAARLATEQANRAGGYEGRPFRLVSAWSENPWGSGVKDLTRLVFVDRVWAVIGGIDGPSTHLAEQVVTKAGLTLLNPVSTDKTVNLIDVPWIFSCTPQDHLQAKALADGLALRLGRNPFVLAAAVDHDSHLFAVELEKVLTAGRDAQSYTCTCAHRYEFNPASDDWKGLVAQICSNKIDTVVLVAGAGPSARLLRALRDGGYTGRIFGGPWLAQRAFAAEAGRAADGVIFPCSYVSSTRSAAFEERFRQRFGTTPDYLAAYTYDAANLLVAAIRRTGLNRARIRDAVRGLSPWEGVSGTITWDAPGANSAPVYLGTIRDGQVLPLAANAVISGVSSSRPR